MADEIKFGTDGWRALIADRFTFENVARVAQAACDVARSISHSRLILVGFDRRFFSDRFAATAAEVIAGNGFRAELSRAPIGSPVLSFQVKRRKAALGFMITASHNPYDFDGFKLKGPHGGSVDESITQKVEVRLDEGELRRSSTGIRSADFIPDYLAWLKKTVSLTRIKNRPGPFVFDAMHGPGGVLMEQLLGGAKNIRWIRKEADPLFGGVNPEPIEKNLLALKEAVIANKAAAGFAVDGDADRIGVVDDKGRYLSPHTVMPLLLLHLVEHRKLKGSVVQAVSMGYLTARIAKAFKLPFEETAVGFKYIAKRMGETKVLLGGEESGGFGVGLWSPERDGLLCTLLLLEMLAVKNQPLSAVVDEMTKRFGASHFERIDFTLPEAPNKQEWVAKVASLVTDQMAGQPIRQVLTLDGFKVVTVDDSWVLMRPSGTEPLLRTYSEGTSPEIVRLLLTEAHRLAEIAAQPPKRTAGDAAKKKAKKKAAAVRSA